jgi:hypothetical protein
MAPVVAGVAAWRAEHPTGRLFLVTGIDSWLLPFFTRKDLRVEPIGLAALPALLAAERQGPAALLVLNGPELRPLPDKVAELRRFSPERGTVLYDLAPVHTARARRTIEFGEGFWSAETRDGAEFRWARGRATLHVHTDRNENACLGLRAFTPFTDTPFQITLTTGSQEVGRVRAATARFDEAPESGLLVPLSAGRNVVELVSDGPERLFANDPRLVAFGLALPLHISEAPAGVASTGPATEARCSSPSASR